MPGIFSRQGVGAGAPFGYVCHSIISYLDCPFALTGLGAFLLYVAKIPGVEGSTFLSLVHREGHFSTLGIQWCRVMWRALLVGMGRFWTWTT